MKAATLPNKPGFNLMKQTDIQSFYHMQMPRWLFFDKKYSALTLEAKVVYTFLLNRFQLSKLNNWINGDGEVFIIYTRQSLADEIQISYRRVIDSMKELSAMHLIWERRCGRGDANQIYLAQANLTGETAAGYGSAPFVAPEDLRSAESACLDDDPDCETDSEHPQERDDDTSPRPANTAGLDESDDTAPNSPESVHPQANDQPTTQPSPAQAAHPDSDGKPATNTHQPSPAQTQAKPAYAEYAKPAEKPASGTPQPSLAQAKVKPTDAKSTGATCQGLPSLQVKTCENGTSGSAGSASLDMRNPHTSYTDMSNTELSNSQPVRDARAENQAGGRTDDEIAELDEILFNCDLWTFKPETAKVFENAIERLFFSESFRIGNSVLPNRKVRSHLHELDQMKLETAEYKISRNPSAGIRNTTAYVMAVIFNSIWETESDLMCDPYLNSLRSEPYQGNSERRDC